MFRANRFARIALRIARATKVEHVNVCVCVLLICWYSMCVCVGSARVHECMRVLFCRMSSSGPSSYKLNAATITDEEGVRCGDWGRGG